MSNLAGKAYGMNVVTPMRPWVTWINNLLFMLSRSLPATLSGLLGLGFIHFARWVIIRRDQWPQLGQPPSDLSNDYMLFCSNFNGTWDQYIDAFADGIPGGLDLFWYSSTKYPNSIPITPFKNYIRANQIDTNYYYNATPGSGQRDIKLALKLSHGLAAIAAKAGTLSDAELASAFERLLIANQGGLGAPGYAPVASCDTAAADRNRAAAELGHWGRDGTGPIAADRALHPIATETVIASSANADEDARESVRTKVAAVLRAPTPGTPGTEPPPTADASADKEGERSDG
ncbi:hypothetical protein ACNFJ7_05685 [Sphingomonas sp. HT-1]|uniref:hypothetical protein n=1 Tax=unclassified Sphingomonas TaxID=196159 RepID=UPI0002D84E17|nr:MULTISPECIES: hypothetical protein [unclassified Sphingomonas]KTF68508.1 hypothetical protein ATB93_13595 [Sphingomonas sp. WG]